MDSILVSLNVIIVISEPVAHRFYCKMAYFEVKYWIVCSPMHLYEYVSARNCIGDTILKLPNLMCICIYIEPRFCIGSPNHFTCICPNPEQNCIFCNKVAISLSTPICHSIILYVVWQATVGMLLSVEPFLLHNKPQFWVVTTEPDQFFTTKVSTTTRICTERNGHFGHHTRIA